MLYPNEVKMPTPLKEIYDSLAGLLGKITGNEPPSMARSARLLEATARAMEELKTYVKEHPFAGQVEEIFFFKHIKPLFYRQFLFYRELYFMDVNVPEGGGKVTRQFYKKKLKMIREYFDEHRAMYEYMRRGATFRDELYFLREPLTHPGVEVGLPDIDRAFATIKDFEVAEILKTELLQEYLIGQLAGEDKRPGTTGEDSGIQWTATLNAFYQLMRALIRKGAINNGNITMSKFAEKCETFFHIDLKNMYRGMQENRIKKDRSAFLKDLVKAHEDDLDEMDENPRYK